MRLSFTCNGRAFDATVEAGESLMAVLRRLGMSSVKDGCARGDCGSCAVLLDGAAVTSCLTFAAKAEGKAVTTVEGLTARAGALHPLQLAMLDSGGVQCGYCIPGILMTAVELLERDPAPSEQSVREQLAGNLCRCTGYIKQIEGVLAAAAIHQGAGDG